MKVDWHSALLTRTTLVDKHYRNTQNVRRFLTEQCGEDFRFDRDFMAWIAMECHKRWAMWPMSGSAGSHRNADILNSESPMLRTQFTRSSVHSVQFFHHLIR